MSTLGSYLLALDAGTTSARALVFDRSGQVVGLGRRSLRLHTPREGWVEQEPDQLWTAQRDACLEALSVSGVSLRDVATIGLTNQRETTLLWDRGTGQPVGPAIVWQDRRTADRCAELRAQRHETEVQQRTGLTLDPYFSATKLAWLLDHLPQARTRAEAGELAFGTVDTWLLWHLTEGKVHATDVSNASRTLLFNLNTCTWDPWLLKLFGIPEAVLPEVRPSAARFGTTTALGNENSIPIDGVIGDQQAATFGQGCFEPGQAKNTYGTGCFMLKVLGTEPVLSRHRLLTTIGWQLDSSPVYALEGSVFNAGATLQWLESIGLLTDYRALDDLHDPAPEGLYLVPGFTGLGAPYWDAQARGLIIGLTRGTRREDLLRAGLEAMAYQTQEVLEAMYADDGKPLASLCVDGGVALNNPLMQFQASLSGVVIDRPVSVETTAQGAAWLAALHAGYYGSLHEVLALRKTAARFSPQPAALRPEAYAHWKQAVQRSLAWSHT